MFGIEEKVINGNGIACVIDRIELMKIPHSKIKKDYYVMHDLHNSDNIFYIPTDSENIRYPLTMSQAKELIESIKDIQQIKVSAERFRDEIYRNCLKESSPKTLIAMLKFFVYKKKERSSIGKSLPAIDEKYMKLTSRNLFSELSCSLSMPVEEVERIIYQQI